MRHKKFIVITIVVVFFVTGYLVGRWAYLSRAKKPTAKTNRANVESVFGAEIAERNTGKIYLIDTLASHERNLLVFWSPTCKFCRTFFQNQLNSEIVGIFCYPLTDDIEYLDYFTEHHRIEYPQLMDISSGEERPVEASFVEAIPKFVITNSYGDVIFEQYGIENIETIIDKLYEKN